MADKQIFVDLSPVAFRNCRLVCKEWQHFIDTVIQASIYHSNHRQKKCKYLVPYAYV